MTGRDEHAGCQLYLITPPVLEPAAFAPRLAEALDAGPVACLQLRLKPADDDAIRRAAAALLPVCHERGVPLLMNDRPDLAVETGCDGCHVGQEDAPFQEARRLMGPDAMIGVTCGRSGHLAVEAADRGADYVAFGAFFPSTTKEPEQWARPGILSWWREISVVPSVAIGGITVANCRPLIGARADFLAVVAGVWNHDGGPGAAVRAFNRIFTGE